MLSIDAKQLAELSHEPDVIIVDIRSPSAWLGGVPKQAVLLSHAELFKQAKQLKIAGKTTYIICYRGQSSAKLAEQLAQQWGDCFYSVYGGFEAWQAYGLPTEIPTDVPTVDRYDRQTKLSELGETGQQKLLNSHVFVVGAGGLGASALLYLAGAGIGRITLVDDDTIALHNLHRQIIYQQADVGLHKAEVAKQRLQALNPDIEIHSLRQRLNSDNAEQLLFDVDLVVDGSDNIKTRYAINDACLKLNKPWLFAAVSGYAIQLALFSGEAGDPCYRCLFPHISDAQVENCSEAGILGPVPGLAGVLQATEAVKYLAGLEGSLVQKMLSYDVQHHQLKVLKYPLHVNINCNH